MKIISFIDDQLRVNKILKHLDLWDVKRKPPARANGPPPEAFIIFDDSPTPGVDDPASLLILRRTGAISLLMLRRTGYLIDPEYPAEAYL